jgi:signal transduction histidine kinase
VTGAAVLRAPGPVKLALMVTLFAIWAGASAFAYSWRAAKIRLAVAVRAQVRLAAAEERRRIQRDVHDGAQQRLFAASILMDMAKQQLERPTGDPDDAASAAAAVSQAQGQLADAIRALRELTTGVYPQPLVEDGVATALERLCDRSPIPVVLDVDRARWPQPVEFTAYFLVAEALTNVYRHAHAGKATVTVRDQQTTSGHALQVTVADDGVGGATVGPAGGGSGLRGLGDRVAAVGGHLRIDSVAGEGTTLHATLPIREMERC